MQTPSFLPGLWLRASSVPETSSFFPWAICAEGDFGGTLDSEQGTTGPGGEGGQEPQWVPACMWGEAVLSFSQ